MIEMIINVSCRQMGLEDYVADEAQDRSLVSLVSAINDLNKQGHRRHMPLCRPEYQWAQSAGVTSTSANLLL